MVRRILVLSSLLISPMLITAQNPVRCGTYEHWKQLKLENPALEEAEKKVYDDARKWKKYQPAARVSTVITIPVVVHLLYSNNAQNISDSQIQSQIDVLNEDYSKTNFDFNLTPLAWRPIAADVQLQFCLASIDPAGFATSGIERRETPVSSFGDWDEMKFYSTGGLDAWDRHFYLNIWVGNLGNNILGISQMPGGADATDGLCINYRAFGRVGSLLQKYDKGRTATHEVGHWLGILHPWGDDAGNCTGNDNMGDTPNQADAVFDCPPYPTTDNCSWDNTPGNEGDPVNGIIFMNFMQYTDDDCMYMFTTDQATEMNAVLNTYRPGIITSQNCNGRILPPEKRIVAYPNPVSSELQIDAYYEAPTTIKISIIDITGRVVMETTKDLATEKYRFDVTALRAGAYFFKFESSDFSVSKRVIVTNLKSKE